MGWTYYHEKPHNVKQELNNLLTWESERGTHKVLDSAIVNMREYYAAVECAKPDGTRYVFACIFLLDFARGEFGYKDMDESCGPNADNCPARILDLLTPLPSPELSEPGSKYAAEWRARCRAKIAARKSFTPGTTIKTPHPIRLTNGMSCDTFTIERHGRTGRGRRYRMPNGMLCQLNKRCLEGATVVNPAN